MKKRKLLVLSISVWIVVLLLLGLSSVTVCAESKKILWRMNSWMPSEGRIEHDHLQLACDEIYKRSNRRLKIEIYPAFALGLSPKTWLRDMRDGAIDIWYRAGLKLTKRRLYKDSGLKLEKHRLEYI